MQLYTQPNPVFYKGAGIQTQPLVCAEKALFNNEPSSCRQCSFLQDYIIINEVYLLITRNWHLINEVYSNSNFSCLPNSEENIASLCSKVEVCLTIKFITDDYVSPLGGLEHLKGIVLILKQKLVWAGKMTHQIKVIFHKPDDLEFGNLT